MLKLFPFPSVREDPSDTVPGRRRGARIAAGAATHMLALAGCSAGAISSPQPSMLMADPGFPPFGHIHGFGINDRTGTSYVASHDGLYELPAIGSPTVATSKLPGPIDRTKDDLMGFVQRGDLQFASGHPATMTGDLGLIERVGASGKWRTVALADTTDFHALDVVVNPDDTFTALGYDAATSTVNVSHDSGRTWTAGDVIELRDLTADATLPGVLYATTANGLMVSKTYGAHWKLVAGAPSLYLVESLNSTAGGDLIGVDVHQQLWAKSAATKWRKTGVLRGQADALTYSSSSGGILLTDDDRGIIVSRDLGTSWKVLVKR